MHDIFFQNLLRAFIAIDPISLIPVFAVLTNNLNPKVIIKLAFLVFLISSSVLAFFSFFGNNFLIFMGISLGSFQIIGGLFLLFISFEMVLEKRLKRKKSIIKKILSDEEISDLAVFPISIPLVVGPSAITLSILISKNLKFSLVSFYEQILPIILTLMISSVILLFANVIINFLNKIIITIMQKVFGIILGALSIQYIINGIKESFL